MPLKDNFSSLPLSYAVLESSSIRALEAQAEQDGTSLLLLMERAGKTVVSFILEHFPKQTVIILCGPGNNGGDGYCIAQCLLDQGWPVEVWKYPPGSSKPLPYPAQEMYTVFKGSIKDLSLDIPIDPYALYVDALFGVGLVRPLDALLKTFAEKLSALSVSVIAVDIPSGIQADTGEVLGAAFKATHTITFECYKPGLLLLPGKFYTGNIHVASIDLPVPSSPPKIYVNEPDLWQTAFPWPTLFDHKYTRGKGLVLGGEVFTGAARLAGEAARRIGLGLVSIACTPKTFPIYATACPGILPYILSSKVSFLDLLENRVTSLLIGPGLFPSQRLKSLLLHLFKQPISLILDGGALRALAEFPLIPWQNKKCPLILTPHVGEFSSLFPSITGTKIERALQAAALTQSIIVYKGADTIIASPNGHAYIQEAACPYLATGGTGDVLAGLILGLIGQKVDPFTACAMAVWIHNEAAHLFGPGLLAEDISNLVPCVLENFLST